MENNIPPERVIKAEYTRPALEDCPKNTMQAKIFVVIRPTHGTPSLFVRPMNFGAFPLRDMKSSVLDATYSELFPAEMTLITIRALIRWAAGRIPASCKEIVKGELAVFEDDPSNLSSFHGMRIPMKNIVPELKLAVVWFHFAVCTHQRRKSRYAKRPA